MSLFFKPTNLPLSKYEKKVTKKAATIDEGVIEAALNIIGFESRFCIEFGAGDGYHYSFSHNLIENHGFGALLIEAGTESSKKLLERYKDHPKVKAVQSFITVDNIEQLFSENGVPAVPDFITIDIDGNDYHIWKKITRFQPRLVCIEYNPSFPPPKQFIKEYKEDFAWSGDDYYGASMQSMIDLGKEKGYELIHCTSTGDNLYFVKKELFSKFNISDNSPATMYQLPRYGKYGRAINGKGHPTSKLNSTSGERLWNKIRYYFLSPFRKI